MRRASIWKSVMTATAGVALILLGQERADAGTTVISMPPPPKPARQTAPADIEDVADPTEIVTWWDRAVEADVSGNERSYLGIVALTRYARAKSGPRYSYYNPYSYGYGSFSHFHPHHFPFNVSFLHGVPIWGIEFPWVGFRKHSPWWFCW